MSETDTLPKLAITMGDPAGIGPEIVLRALSHSDLYERCIPIVLGDPGVMQKLRRELGLSCHCQQIHEPHEAEAGRPNLIGLSNIKLDTFHFGVSRTDLGLISTFYIVKAAEYAVGGHVEALVTGPINKAMLNQAGYNYSSHTEMLKAYTLADHSVAMMLGDHLRLVRVTSHIPLREVAATLTVERVLNAIRITHQALRRDFEISAPHLAVCALNPHAGESGLFGEEESAIIAPAIQAALEEGIHVTGPHPADTVFPRARDGQFDAVVCMYHDQGQIAFRLIDFGYGVNVTLGLPIIRTAPEHGTAYDIAGRGRASEKSMIKAIDLAASLAVKRRHRLAKSAEQRRAAIETP